MARSVLVLALAGALVAACGGSSLSATPTSSPGTSGTGSPMPTATPPPAPTATATLPPLPEVSGIFTTPQWRPADQLRPLSPAPASPFPPHDGESVVLYDTELGTVRNLGPGMYGTFTEDGRYMAWTDAQGDLWYVELPDGDPVKLGTGGSIVAVGGPVVAVDSASGALLWDLSTGSSTVGRAPGNGDIREDQGPYVLIRDFSGEGWVFQVVSGMDLLFAPTPALTASWAGPGEVVIAAEGTGGVANVFLVDIETATASFVATAAARFNALAVVANERWIAWTNDYCGAIVPGGVQGATRVLDRSTGAIYDLGAAVWPEGFTPDGRLSTGHGFGALSLIDLDTWAYDVVLPEGSVDVHWSPGYRYASRGMVVGHGGMCSY